MIVLRCAQGTEEWTRARLGIATSSKFDRIITPAKLAPSSQAEKYRYELLAEWLEGYPVNDDFGNGWTDRGTELEPEARAKYEFLRDVEVEEVGFIMTDDGMAGCSPDGLVGEDGGLEIKCPALHTHLRYLLHPDRLVDDYKVQIQGSLYVAERKYWDAMSYHPAVESVLVRVEPDPDFREAFGPLLDDFKAQLKADRTALLDRGLKPKPPLPTAEAMEEWDRDAQLAEMERDYLAEQSTMANADYARAAS